MRMPLIIALIGLSYPPFILVTFSFTLRYSAAQENNIQQWSNPRTRLWCSCLIYRSLGTQNLCVCFSRALAICRSILDLVLTVNEMLFSDGGFKPWRDRSKIIPHTESVHYVWHHLNILDDFY